MKKRQFAWTLILGAMILSAGRCLSQSVDLVQGENQVDVMVDGRLFTSYRYDSVLTKPMLLPVNTPSGVSINRNFPPDPAKAESADHPHHTGIFFTYDQVNGVGFWNNTTSPPQIKNVRIISMAGGPGPCVLQTLLHWIAPDGGVLLEEQRTMTFQADKNAREIYFQIRLTAQDQPVLFEDTKEGLFAIRVADWLSEKNGTGRYLNSEGQETEKNVWGRRARWVRLEGNKDGKTAGVAIFNLPGSVNYPTYWHAGYGLFAANPLGQFDFQKATGEQNPQKFSLMLNPGMSANFRFLVLVYDGTKSPAELEKYFTGVSNPDFR